MKVLYLVCWCCKIYTEIGGTEGRKTVGKRACTSACIQTPHPRKRKYTVGVSEGHAPEACSVSTPDHRNRPSHVKSYCLFVVSIICFLLYSANTYYLCAQHSSRARNMVVNKKDKVPAFVEFTFYIYI